MTLTGKVARLAAAASMTLAAVAATAYPSFVKEFCDLQKAKKGSNVEKASCALCHVGKTLKLNAYGKDMQKAMKAAQAEKLSTAILKKLADLDSDKDGIKNAEELKADTLPGDEKSVPAKANA